MNIKVLKKIKVYILKYKHEKYKCKGDVNMRKEVVFN